MNVIQFAGNQVMTRKAAPVLTSSSLNAPSYNKNANAIISFDFTNSDSANITSLNINNTATVPDATSTTTVVKSTNPVGNSASQTVDDFDFAISSFTYFDGFEEIIFNISPVIELSYSVIKDVPTAEIIPTRILDNGLTFNVIVTDPDGAITSTELNANLYRNGTTTPVVETTAVALVGGQGYQITNLNAATLYDMYIYGSYDTFDNANHTNVAISPLTPVLTIPNQAIEIMTMTTTASYNTITIDSATFAGAGTGNVVSGEVQADVKVTNLQQ